MSDTPDRETGLTGSELYQKSGPSPPDEDSDSDSEDGTEQSSETVQETEAESGSETESVSTSVTEPEPGASEPSPGTEPTTDGGATEATQGTETQTTSNVIAVSQPEDEPLPSSRQLAIPSRESRPVEHTSFPYIMARNDTTEGRHQKNMRIREETLSAIQDVAHVMMKKRYAGNNLSAFDVQEAILWAGLWNLEDVDAALQMMGAGVKPDF